MSLIPYDDDLFSFPSFPDVFSSQKMFSNPIKIDVVEHKDSYMVVADLPAGVAKSDVKLEFENGYLTLNAEVNSSSTCDCKSCRCVMKERFSGHYSRRIFVADNLDRSKITASYNDCVLKVVIPKLAQANSESKFIDIN